MKKNTIPTTQSYEPVPQNTPMESRGPIIEREANVQTLFQYHINGNQFMPCGNTRPTLPAGCYNIYQHHDGSWIFNKEKNDTYDLIEFKDSAGDEIMAEFDEFWKRKDEYDKRGEPHKRGYLLCGPPGSGKTCLVRMMVDKFTGNGNIVFTLNHIPIEGLKTFQEVEPDRKIMIVLEDVEAMLNYTEDEQALLQLLDGGIQHSNTVIIATTNYPEKLPDRIVNRPSRIDRVVEIDMPTRAMRASYIEQKAFHIKEEQLEDWLDDTKDFSFAHVKELIMSVEVYNIDYNTALGRIKIMRQKAIDSSHWDGKLHGEKEQAGIGFN